MNAEATSRPDRLEDIAIGVIGAGENTRLRHLPGLRALPGVRIAGVCNRSEFSGRRVAEAFSIPRVYPDWQTAVADPETRAIVIGTWPDSHARLAIAALEAGKHVLCEARMARNLDEARAMLDAARRRPLLTAQLVPAPMTLGVDETIQRLLAEKWIGDPLVVDWRPAGQRLDPAAPLHWRQNREISGLNIGALGIAYETIRRWLGDAVRVFAMARTFVPIRRNPEGQPVPVRIPDHLDVLAEMACGAQFHFRHSVATDHSVGDGIWLHGSEGTLRFHNSTLYGARRGDAALTPVQIPERERGGWRVEAEFIGAIRGTEKVRRTNFEDGLKYMEFVEAVSRSLTSAHSEDIVTENR